MATQISLVALLTTASLLAFGCSHASPVPQPENSPPQTIAANRHVDFDIELGPEQVAFPQLSLDSHPDAHISTVRYTDNTISLWLAAGVSSYLFRGSSIESMEPGLKDSSGKPLPVLGPSGSGFDSDYAAFGGVLPGPSGELIGFYHAEQCGRANFTASIGAAVSWDRGLTWQRKGAVLTGRQHTNDCNKSRGRGAGEPTAIQVGDYVYVYYVDWSVGLPDQIHVARAPFARATTPGAWEKYYQGSFSQPGLGGESTPVIRRPEPGNVGIFSANPSVSYNLNLDSFLAIFDSSRGFYAVTSFDGINWGEPRLIFSYPQAHSQVKTGDLWYNYPTLLSPAEASHMYTSGTGYLFYAKGVVGRSSHQTMRRSFTLRVRALSSATAAEHHLISANLSPLESNVADSPSGLAPRRVRLRTRSWRAL